MTTTDKQLKVNPLHGLADELFDNDPIEYARALMRTENVSRHSAACRAHNKLGGSYEETYDALEDGSE